MIRLGKIQSKGDVLNSISLQALSSLNCLTELKQISYQKMHLRKYEPVFGIVI